MRHDELDAAYGVLAGTTRAWARSGVIGPDPSELEWLTAYLCRPASSADHRTRAANLADPDRDNAWAAAVRAALTTAPEVPPCPTTADPARTAVG